MEDRVIFGNLIWRFAERCGAQGVTFVVSIILARILEPQMYGIVALIAVFTAIMSVFIDGGLGTALIQKKNADEVDFSTVFFFNIFMSIVLFGILFFTAPYIAEFYGDVDIIPLVRTLGINLLICGIKNVQQAYVSKNMLFKKFFFSTLCGTVVAGVIGVYMAYSGYGVWAIVVQCVLNSLVDTVVLWFSTGWRPKALFSFERFKVLFAYGWKLLVSGLLDTVYNQARMLIVGKKYSATDLAYYNRGDNFPAFFIENINSSMDSVLFPSFSKNQGSIDVVRRMMSKAIKVSMYVILPLMVGLAAISDNIVMLVLTEKWLPIVPYVRIFCFAYALWPIHTINLNVIKAMGKSDYFLNLEIIKKVIGITAILITMRISVVAIAYSLLITSVLSQLVNAWPNKKMINYGYLKQLKDIMPIIGVSLLMGAVVYPIGFIGTYSVIGIVSQIIVGILVYLGASYLFKLEPLFIILNFIKAYIGVRNKNGNNESNVCS